MAPNDEGLCTPQFSIRRCVPLQPITGVQEGAIQTVKTTSSTVVTTVPADKVENPLKLILDSISRQDALIQAFTVEVRGLLQLHHEGHKGHIDIRVQKLSEEVARLPEQLSTTMASTKSVPIILKSEEAQAEAEAEAKKAEQEAAKGAPQNAIEIARARKRASVEEERKVTINEDVWKKGAHAHNLRVIIHGWQFDIIMSIVILVNIVIMATQLQMKGYSSGHHLELRNDDNGWKSSIAIFETLELLFNIIYLSELILRVWALGVGFLCHPFNMADAIIVLITCFETMVLQPFNIKADMLNLSALRVVRVFRIFRLHRIMNASEHMGEMRILIQTLVVSMRGLLWSIMLICGIILAGAIIMAQLTFVFLEDETIELEKRQKLHQWFGTTARSFYTMFECTFTGNWRNYARPVIEDFHSGFAFFFLPYVVYVNFAVMRVIAALFLKQTLTCAANEEERTQSEEKAKREEIANELRQVFQHADSSGDGCISREEFEKMIVEEDVLDHFENLNLEVHEAISLFDILSADDGVADYAEFLNGVCNLRGQARQSDTVALMHKLVKMQLLMEGISSGLGTKAKALPVADDTYKRI